MHYFKQVLTVTLWEYQRFYKIKNELIGLGVMLLMFVFGFYGGRYAVRSVTGTTSITVVDVSEGLVDELSKSFDVNILEGHQADDYIQSIEADQEGVLLMQTEEGFVLHAWKKPNRFKRLQDRLNDYHRNNAIEQKGLTLEDYEYINADAPLQTTYFYVPGRGKNATVAYFFIGFMVMAVFMSFAYQFTAITGEKQLKITEQIVSAIKPQVWMDGKILGITLTGLSSVVLYSFLSVLGGMLFFMFSGAPVSQIAQYLHLPSIGVYLAFTLMGVLMWNALLAAIASVITDPNNSGKGSLMMLPVLFVIASLLVLADPDSTMAVFLSWFPLTSASAMPIRWISTDLHWINLPGSFILLTTTFYLLRRLAAKIFRVSVLISGKEPSWAEVYKMIRES